MFTPWTRIIFPPRSVSATKSARFDQNIEIFRFKSADLSIRFKIIWFQILGFITSGFIQCYGSGSGRIRINDADPGRKSQQNYWEIHTKKSTKISQI